MSIDSSVLNEIHNELTEYSRNYRWINPHISSGYIGLPKSFTKLSNIFFGFIMRTKRYMDKSKEIDEEKRIYNDIVVTMEDILGEWDNEKYSKGENIVTDISNMNKRINELDENNVFHFWKCKGLYMFVMERDLGVWKFYNVHGKVVPKMLKKISSVGNDMIFCMTKNIRKVHGDVDKSYVEKSFGNFINRIIDKMNHLISMEIIKWDGKQDINEYLVSLSEGIKNMDDQAGLIFADDILNKYPRTISNEIKKKMREDFNMKIEPHKEQNMEELEKMLTPKNPNLVRTKRVKKTSSLPVPCQPPSKPIAYEYSGEIDPFADAKQFIRYYQAFLNQCTYGKIKFNTYESDSIYATQIMDMMIENGRSSNRMFLNAWLRYFHDFGLKGHKAMKIKYTSLKSLKETFEVFNGRYLDTPVKTV